MTASDDVRKARIAAFLPKLDELIVKHPEYLYPPYYKAKLLLASGNDSDVLSAFLPFAKQKRNDFWVWEMMADIFVEEKEKQFACYCKALSLKTHEDFLVKLRLTFAALLIERKMYNEAKTEIQQVIATRQKHGWKLTGQIVQWTEQEWYRVAEANENNSALYSMHLKVAEEILFHDIQEEIIAVEFVNENKNMLHFVKDKQKFGFFKYSNISEKPLIGDILKVRFSDEGREGYFKVLTVKRADPELASDAIKYFEGSLNLISPQNFGFINDIFVEPTLIRGNDLTDGQVLSGRAILSFNKKKDEWGWKAVEIKK